MDVRISITVNDWLIAKKYGCKLSYSEFLRMYEVQKVVIGIVVNAWIAYFTKNAL